MNDIKEGATGINPTIKVLCLNITALISALAITYVCDILRRRLSVRLGATVYLVSAFMTIFSSNLACLIAVRSIQGVGVGFLPMAVPVIQAEIAPGQTRGLFVGIEYLCLNVSYAISAWVGYTFFFAMLSEISWKGSHVIQAGLAALLLAWTFGLPETPRWLIKNGFEARGETPQSSGFISLAGSMRPSLSWLADLRGTGAINDPQIPETYKEISHAIMFESSLGSNATSAELFHRYLLCTLVG